MSWRFIPIVVFSLLVLVVPAVRAEVPEISKPNLEKRSTKVLRLRCRPPTDSPTWFGVYNLTLFAFLPERNEYSNETLTYITRPKTEKPNRGRVLPDAARVTFEGSWESTGSLDLSVVMPITSREFGTYYCNSAYKESSGEKKEVYSAGIRVSESSSDERNDRFTATVAKADSVSVTWQSTEHDKPKSKKAEVFVTHIDDEGRAITAPSSLFVTTGKEDLIFDDYVLLAKFKQEPKRYSSVILYVDSKLCHPYCQYSCNVPPKSCIGSNAHLCTCDQATPETIYLALTYIFLSLFIVLFVLVLLHCFLERTASSRWEILKKIMCVPQTNKEKSKVSKKEKSKVSKKEKHEGKDDDSEKEPCLPKPPSETDQAGSSTGMPSSVPQANPIITSPQKSRPQNPSQASHNGFELAPSSSAATQPNPSCSIKEDTGYQNTMAVAGGQLSKEAIKAGFPSTVDLPPDKASDNDISSTRGATSQTSSDTHNSSGHQSEFVLQVPGAEVYKDYTQEEYSDLGIPTKSSSEVS